MKRPKVILGVSASIDGRISLGPNRTMMDMDERDDVLGTRKEWEEFFEEMEQRYEPEVYLEGSNMLISEDADLRELESLENVDTNDLYQDYLPEEIVERPERNGWLAVVDGRGRVRSGYTGEEHKPMLHLVSYQVPAEYLRFLRKTGIPYLIAGEKRVDLEEVLKKLKDRLDVDTVLTSSGGKLSGALLRKGLLDEIYIRFNPVVIGGFETPLLFASPDLEEGQWPTSLKFIDSEVKDSGHIFVRYEVEEERNP